MKETGRVISIDGREASVLFKRTSMCAKCGACGMGSTQDNITVSMPNVLGAAVGDEVQVQFTSRNALASSALGYIFPLLMLLIGILVGYQLPPIGNLAPDILAAIGGLAFAALAFVILKLLDPFFRKHFANVYTMTEILRSR